MANPETTGEQDFAALVSAVKRWTERHMDQWEKFKYADPRFGSGMIYVTISLQDPYPDSFDLVECKND